MQLYLFAILVSTASCQVPLSGFYPYGIQSGDNTLPSQDDASTEIPIQFDYSFFGLIYREVHISTNGILTFGARTSSFTPVLFPIQGMKCIATYWTDSDPSRGGTVLYKETYDPSLLDQISQEIRTRLIQFSTFTSQWALIVTFDSVSAFGCSSSPGNCTSQCSKVVTHQVVLTSNGVNSFVIFNFNKLDYTVGTQCDSHAQIGFNAGDGRRFYLVPYSNTANISNVGLLESNVGIPGKWIFEIDGDDISEGCGTTGLLEIIPRKVLYFGGEYVAIIGPCFNKNDSVISVLFEQTSVVCRIEGGMHANCTVPLLDKPGRNSVSFSYNSFVYESFIIAVGADDSTVLHSSFEMQNTDSPLSEFTLKWNDQSDVGVDILFNGFQKNYYIGEDGAITYQETITIKYGAFLNTGRVTLRPFDSPSPNYRNFRSVFREIMVCGICRGIRLIAGRVNQIERSTQHLVNQHCLSWFAQQPSEREITVIINEVSRQSSCPPGVPTNFPQTMGNFELDSSCNPSGIGKLLCQYFHPGAKGCYRSINNGARPAAQCCYGDDHVLLLGPTGGGTLDFKDSRLSINDHYLADVLPYITCCKIGSNLCNRYLEKRPSIDSRNFRPPGSGNGNGDPHFRTLDGTSYIFNPVGEFTYLTTADGNDIIQVRIAQYVDHVGISTHACYFSGFVVKSWNSDIAQVELNALNMFTFRINGQSMKLENGQWNFNGISINIQNNSTVVIHTVSGIDLEIRILSGMLHIIITLPENFKSTMSGLIGDWDGNSNNDLKLPDGTWIPVDSSNSDIHYKFGMTWSTTTQTSIFTYPTGLTWSDYQDRDFVPDFSIPPSIDACGGNQECDYDARATGDINVGLSNIVIRNRTNEVLKMNSKISRVCPVQVSVVNGNVKVDRDSTGSTVRYSVTCDADFQLVGEDTVSCVDGAFMPLATCQKKPSSSSTSKTCHSLSIVQLFLTACVIFKTM